MNFSNTTSTIVAGKIGTLYRGSSMSARVLLNLLNELKKRLKARLAEHFISFSQRV